MVNAVFVSSGIVLCAALFARSSSWSLRIVATAASVLTISKHPTNIARISQGKEDRI